MRPCGKKRHHLQVDWTLPCTDLRPVAGAAPARPRGRLGGRQSPLTRRRRACLQGGREVPNRPAIARCCVWSQRGERHYTPTRPPPEVEAPDPSVAGRNIPNLGSSCVWVPVHVRTRGATISAARRQGLLRRPPPRYLIGARLSVNIGALARDPDLPPLRRAQQGSGRNSYAASSMKCEGAGCKRTE